MNDQPFDIPKENVLLFCNVNAKFGENAHKIHTNKSFLEFWLESFKDLTVITLLIAGLLSLVLEAVFPDETDEECESDSEKTNVAWVEGLGIIVMTVFITIISASINYIKERRLSEIAQLEQHSPVKVIRDGEQQQIEVSDVLVGDVVRLIAGDQIPADGILLSGHGLKVNEGDITGEREDVKKDSENIFLLGGSKVVGGSCDMIVLGVGADTEWGRQVEETRIKPKPTPLQLTIGRLLRAFSKISIVAAAIVFVIMLGTWLERAVMFSRVVCNNQRCVHVDPNSNWELNPNCKEIGYDWSGSRVLVAYFVTAVSIIVMITPEGLPLEVTLSLSFAVKEMYKRSVLVRRFKVCESIANCTTICTDKTGTLTENKMRVVRGKIGTDEFYAPLTENFLRSAPAALIEPLRLGIALNTTESSNYYEHEDEQLSFVGSPTECSLLYFSDSNLGSSYKKERSTFLPGIQFRKPFDSATKRMATWVDFTPIATGEEFDAIPELKEFATGRKLFVKGAPDVVLKQCVSRFDEHGAVVELTEEEREGLRRYAEELGESGLRAICLAYRDLSVKLPEYAAVLRKRELEAQRKIDKKAAHKMGISLQAYLREKERDAEYPKIMEDEDNSLTYLGVFGIDDPLRPEVPCAIRTCLKAGISVRLVSGDSMAIAKYIATQCGILRSNGICIEGAEFSKKTDAELDEIIDRIQVLASCSPDDKRRFVTSLIDRGEVVAVTGDSPSDVKALKEADIAMSMGQRGSDVAKQLSDVVILDDNFRSVVTTVSWGRTIFDNIRKFLQFQITMSIVAFMVTCVGIIFDKGSPIKPMQLLWINLISDSFAAFVFGSEKPAERMMNRKPHGRKQRLINSNMLRLIITQSIFQTVVLLVLLFVGPKMDWLHVPCAFAEKGKQGDQSKCTINGTHATNTEIDDQTTELSSIIFNCFVLLQLGSQLLCRKVHGELNPFSGIMKHRLIFVVTALVVCLQVIFVVFTGPVFSVTPYPGISLEGWVTSLCVMVVSWPLSYLLMMLPVQRKLLQKRHKGRQPSSDAGNHKNDDVATAAEKDIEMQPRVRRAFLLEQDLDSTESSTRPSLDYPTPYEERMWERYNAGEQLPSGVKLPLLRNRKHNDIQTLQHEDANNKNEECTLLHHQQQSPHLQHHHHHHHHHHNNNNNNNHSDEEHKEQSEESLKQPESSKQKDITTSSNIDESSNECTSQKSSQTENTTSSNSSTETSRASVQQNNDSNKSSDSTESEREANNTSSTSENEQGSD